MEDMEYYTRRLQCSSAEKDACLETVVKLYRLRWHLRKHGFLAALELAETEEDAFFRAGLLDLVDTGADPEEMERVFTQYLMAGDYRGGAFLNAVLISRGLVLIARREGPDGGELREKGENWAGLLCGTLRGWFGVEYREKVTAVLQQADREERDQRKRVSPLREFDRLTKLTPEQRDWLVRNVSGQTLRYALKVSGSAVREFLMAGMEDRELFEKSMEDTADVRLTDVEAAQREMLEKAREELGAFSSVLPEFDNLADLTPLQRDWLVGHVPRVHLLRALACGGSVAREFLLEGAEDRKALERDLAALGEVRKMDRMAAQRAVLLKAEEARRCT